MPSFHVTPIRTPIFQAQQNLVDFIFMNIPKNLVHEGAVLAVTSKILSLAEGRLVPKARISKEELIRAEADIYLGKLDYGSHLTIKHGLLIPSAGIDESNSQSGDYILFPKDPFAMANNIWQDLRKRWNLQNLGILITDSHTTPLRRGVNGIALCFWGFRPIRKLVGTKDLFGRELVMTQINLLDGMAATAVMVMGEGNESTPLAVCSGMDLEFTDGNFADEVTVPLDQDIYAPLLKSFLQGNG